MDYDDSDYGYNDYNQLVASFSSNLKIVKTFRFQIRIQYLRFSVKANFYAWDITCWFL